MLFLASADIDVFLQEDQERGEDQDQQQREGSGALSRESAPEEEKTELQGDFATLN